MTAPIKSFRSSLVVLIGWTSIFCAVLALVAFGMIWFAGIAYPIEMFIPFGVLWCALTLLFAITVVLFPVYVSHEGIKCYNFWGTYSQVRWSEIKELRRQNLLGLKYLRVASQNGGVEIWLPLYLSDMADFIRVVRDHAGPDHPLVKALVASSEPEA